MSCLNYETNKEKMVAPQELSVQENYSESMRVRDLEERQKLLKDRVLLLGENLVSLRGEVLQELSSAKKDIERIKDDIERLKDIIKRISEEIDGKARREDLAILQNQAKMFEPLNLATLEDVERMINEARKSKRD